ncbi:MAG: motility associated factor glycosyltransferase family protein, partial [Leptospiraceae bacterium]|nr:motility associated factor glycosyltransferase family protein [Leptospiraceae bacterium]
MSAFDLKYKIDRAILNALEFTSQTVRREFESLCNDPQRINGRGFTIEPTRDGRQTLIWAGRVLHSKHGPVKEAHRTIAQIEVGRADQLVLFFGGGLGYAIRSFCSQRENPCVWIEPLPEIIFLALQCVDVRDALEGGQLRILVGVPDDDSLEKLFRGRSNEDIIFFPHRASFAADVRYQSIWKRCESYLNRKSVNLATLARFDRLWARNTIANFPAILRGRPARLLFGSLPEMTAVVCGAGPSLSESLADLKAVRSQIVLIAVDTALRILNAHGIDPDFVLSVDPQPVNAFFLEGYSGRARFIIDPTVGYTGVRHIPPDRLYYFQSPFSLARLIQKYMPTEPGEVAFGGSVSTNAYDFALRLGCTRIVLLGQDLAFTGGQAHARGAVLEDRLNLKESRLFRRQLHNYNQLSALPVRWLPGIQGGQVRTNDKLIMFYQWFSRRIPQDVSDGIRVWNATTAGALIPHAEQLQLSYFESRLESRYKAALPNVQQVLQVIEQNSHPEDQINQNDFLSELRTLVEELRDYRSLLHQGVELAGEILAHVDASRFTEDYNARLKRMSELDEKVLSKPELSELLSTAIQGVIVRITENFQIESPVTDDGSRRANAIQTLELYQGLLN